MFCVVTLSMIIKYHFAKCSNDERCNIVCNNAGMLRLVMLCANGIMPSMVMLNIILLNVVILSVIILYVILPVC
jgi:hypothetical protein